MEEGTIAVIVFVCSAIISLGFVFGLLVETEYTSKPLGDAICKERLGKNYIYVDYDYIDGYDKKVLQCERKKITMKEIHSYDGIEYVEVNP